MTADEVLEEFLLDPCCMDCPASDCINERRMAEEIVRLREENDTLHSQMLSGNLEDRSIIHQLRDVNLRHQEVNDRLRAILAKLREPSEKILLAAVEAVPYGASYAALTRCIPAAVAAAEREVDHFGDANKMVRPEVANDAG